VRVPQHTATPPQGGDQEEVMDTFTDKAGRKRVVRTTRPFTFHTGKSLPAASPPAKRRESCYLTLVRKFPLVPIRDERHLDRAQAVIERLLCRRLSRAEEEYLDVLSSLVEAYEQAHHPIPDVPAHKLLAFLLESNEMSQADLASATGIAKATVSDLVSGKRKPTAQHTVTLGRHFNISPTAFLPSD
jgi:HTH-type transcriptional regulator/antitoxin HigA